MNLFADPYPIYRELRSSKGLWWDETRRIWVLTRYKDVVRALNDARLSSAIGNKVVSDNSRRTLPPFDHRGVAPLFFSQIETCDPPQHTRLRRLIRDAIQALNTKSLELFVQTTVNRLVSRLAREGSGDVIRDLALPLPHAVILHVLGIEESEQRTFVSFVNDLLELFSSSRDDLERVCCCVEQLTDFVRSVGKREANDDCNLIKHLMNVGDADDHLALLEIVGNVVLLFAAGRGTTANLIGNGVLCMMRNPKMMASIRREPSLIEPAVEEILRFESPIQAIGRTAACDIHMGNELIRRGEEVVLTLGSANRDECAFSNPEEFHLSWREQRHLAFGHGIHYCVGDRLARLQARLALTALLRLPRVPRIENDSLEWHEDPTFRGLKALRVIF